MVVVSRVICTHLRVKLNTKAISSKRFVEPKDFWDQETQDLIMIFMSLFGIESNIVQAT